MRRGKEWKNFTRVRASIGKWVPDKCRRSGINLRFLHEVSIRRLCEGSFCRKVLFVSRSSRKFRFKFEYKRFFYITIFRFHKIGRNRIKKFTIAKTSANLLLLFFLFIKFIDFCFFS